ncbi:MAG: hypothetical protein EOO40_01140 [Deltaproteobacteria bacterium]|nr:MAG: hypothetical protein EOO40_01140 [Deltaproteobacteria bacterium]
MSTPRLSLVMGSGLTTPSGSEVSLPVPDDGAVHLHLHLAATASPAAEVAKRSLGGWGGLILGIGLMAAFGGGYQLGHRPAPDDVSNLRPMPAPASFVPPEPPMPSIATGGLPAIQRQLATPPQIIPPVRAPQQPGGTTVVPSTAPSAPAPNRNAFGLEN